MSLTSKFIVSKATISFAGRVIARTEEAVVDFGAETVDFDNVQDVQESAGILIIGRPLTVKTVLLDMTAENFQLALGYSGAIVGIGGARVVEFDDSPSEPLEGELTLVGTRVDGAPVTLYLKRAQAIPGSGLTFHKKQQGKLPVTFKKLDADDGTTINGRMVEGDMT